MPSPIETELRVQPSPVPAQIVSLCDGSIAMAPIDCTSCLSNTDLNVVPPSVDFQTPPEAAPTYSSVLPSLPATASSAAMRPLIVAEPMLRMPRPEIVPESNVALGDLSAAMADTALSDRARTANVFVVMFCVLTSRPGKRTAHR